MQYLLADDTLVTSGSSFLWSFFHFLTMGSEPYPSVRNIWVCAFGGSLSMRPTLFSKLSYIPKKSLKIFADL